MFKYSILIALVSILLISACNSGSNSKAKKLQSIKKREYNIRPGFDPLIKGFGCDELKIKTVLAGSKIKQIVVLMGENLLDTVLLPQGKIPASAESDIIISDYNFDGFCEFVIPDKKSESRGGMDYYYFVFDTLNRHFIEITSLPKFIGNFKLDVKNQRVKIYCPDEVCFAYYKFENKEFKLVQGEFK